MIPKGTNEAALIVGCDASSVNCGWAMLVLDSAGRLVAMESNTITTKRGQDLPERIQVLATGMFAVREIVLAERNRVSGVELAPIEIAVEDRILPRSQPRTISALGMGLAVPLAVFRDFPVRMYPPGDVKIALGLPPMTRHAASDRDAPKRSMKDRVHALLCERNFGFTEDVWSGVSFDEADAIAVALCHMNRRR